MKLIFQARDAGLTPACNGGILKSIDDGAISTVSALLDYPGTEDLLLRLRERPWVTLVWQADFTGFPVAQKELVPDLIEESGRFRKNLAQCAVREQIALEARAQVERCIRLYGRAPFAAELPRSMALYEVLSAICDDYSIFYHLSGCCQPTEDSWLELVSCGTAGLVRYHNPNQPGLTFADYGQYDPLAELAHLPVREDSTWIFPLYPCYLDDWILQETLHDEQSLRTVQRMQDVVVLCSQELRQWIQANNVTLVSLSDAVLGRRDYQNHCKATA
ncbi:MAG: ChbG/HpnK family deacetylase [Clostridiales bacterium]|nr:ChbG/HpnK family deacetylase [Clostridiales bacterium]